MKSYLKLKEKAILLRKSGKSYQDIHKLLNIPKSTLNYWLAEIPISKQQRIKLNKNWQKALIKARTKASAVHHLAKQNRINLVEKEVVKLFKGINLNNRILELFLAGLYLGDGFKIEGRLGLGSSNPKILVTFITLIRKLYKVNERRLRSAIFARADQNEKELLNYWSKLLNIPKRQFHRTQIDQRTHYSTSFTNYKGVCSVVYADVGLQRRILAISNMMLKYINETNRSRSSAG